MAIIEKIGEQYISPIINPKEVKKLTPSSYKPTEDEKKILNMVIDHYARGSNLLNKPRKELDDLSIVQASRAFQLRFNTYTPNDGKGYEGDPDNWRSRAIKPVQRNKVISIAAHATARQIFPKIFATDKFNNTQQTASKVMELLMEKAGSLAKYDKTFFKAVIMSLVNVYSAVYSEYGHVYQNVKGEKDKETGKYKIEKKLNETYSGFRDEVLLPEELIFENYYEDDIQKQGYLAKRKVISYSQAQIKYSDKKNFAYVTPGSQCIGSNDQYYYRTDDELQTIGVEEVIYWNKSLDVRLVILNGVLITDADEPNPRIDKLYPISKFGYEMFGNVNCFIYKSLISKMDKDADIVNVLYRILIDGTLLQVMPPAYAIGSDNTVEASVLTPGSMTTFSSPDMKVGSIMSGSNLQSAFNMLSTVESSIDQSSASPINQGQAAGGTQTAFEISKLEQNANTVLGLYTKMIGDFVVQLGELRKGDILQYLTVARVEDIMDNNQLVYETFIVNSDSKTSKIDFNSEYPKDMTADESLQASYDVLEQENNDVALYKVHPEIFSQYKYSCVVSPDVLQPRSEELERALKLDLYNLAIANPMADPAKVTEDFLFGAYKDIKDPKEYMKDASANMMDPNYTPNPNEVAGETLQPTV